MVIEGNRITLFTDECLLQPTPENAFIVYTFEQFQDQNGEYLITNRENYRRIKDVLKDHDIIEIAVRTL